MEPTLARGFIKVFTVTPTLDTSAYAAGDLLFDATEITDAARYTKGGGTIVGVSLIDADDQTAHAIDLLFYDATVDDGTLNAAPSASDADSAKYVGRIQLTSANANDMTNNIIYSSTAIVPFTCAVTSLFVVGVNVAGTPTQTAAGITLRVYIAQD